MQPRSIYRWFDAAGNLLYIGVAFNVIQRTKAHASNSKWINQVEHCKVVHFESSEIAMMEEFRAIREEKPLYNVVGNYSRQRNPSNSITSNGTRRQIIGTKRAEEYLKTHPETPAADLAKKFKIALTTVYRAPWWKNRAKEQK